MLGAAARRRRARRRPVLAALSARRRARRRCPPIGEIAAGAVRHVGSAAPGNGGRDPRRRHDGRSRRSRAAETLAEEGLDVTVVNCRFLKPYDEVTLAAILAQHRQILVVEEGTVVNGFGAYHGRGHRAPRFRRCACTRTACPIASSTRRRARKQLAALGLDAAGIARSRARAARERGAGRVIRLGVVGHLGYGGLADVLATLRRLAPDARARSSPTRTTLLQRRRRVGAARSTRRTSTRCSRSAATARCCAARASSRDRAVPILGVNLGRLGFLTCCPASQLEEALRRLASKRLRRRSRA